MDGKHIKTKIMESHLSQKEVAERMGVTPQTISSMLTGKNIGSEVLEKLCTAIGKTINQIYEGYKDNEFFEKINSPVIIPGKNEEQESEIVKRLMDMIEAKDIELHKKDEMIMNLYRENMKLMYGHNDQDGLSQENPMEAVQP